MKCTEPLEIERRFLIRRPSEEELRRRCGHIYRMEQTYLLAPPPPDGAGLAAGRDGGGLFPHGED